MDIHKTIFKKCLCFVFALTILFLCACGANNTGPSGPLVDQTFAVAPRDLESRVSPPKDLPGYKEQQADFDRFVAYMNEKASSLGMSQTVFNDAAGMHNLSTARDLLRLAVYAKQYPELDRIWSTPSHTITVSGLRDFTKDVSWGTHKDLDPYYTVLGQKGGSLSYYFSRTNHLFVSNLVSILEIPDSEDLLFVVVMYAKEGTEDPLNSRHATRQVADIAMALYNDPKADVSNMSICCENAIAAVLPAGKTHYEDLQILYALNADMQGRPMSVSKIMTAVCILDHVQDLSQTITYHNWDTNIGLFYTEDYLPGDQMTYADAMYALMISSSNITAQALARETGAIMAAE